MKITPTLCPEVLLIEPRVFGDSRGFFLESFNQREFDAAVGHEVRFVQDNHSRSGQGVLRGLHFQLPPHAQGKLVRVARGSVFDVAVDMRANSPAFGRWVGIELSESNHCQMWIPPGFAHGFLVLSESADFLYKTTDYYAPADEGAVRWDDPDLAIDWPAISVPITLSGKDSAAPWLVDAAVFR
jgi:dTDP-4-dehydrorhamnose 3,5-epimerase